MTTVYAYNGRYLTVHDTGPAKDRVDLTMGQAAADAVHSPIFGNFKQDELYAALGVVSKENLETTSRMMQAYADRAEAAENEARKERQHCQQHANQKEQLRDCAEKAEAERDFRRDENRELAEALKAAEAKLERVRALLENADADDLKVRFYNKLQRALAEPKPELPTETGSVIIATFDCVGTVYTKPIRRTANGSWITLDEKQMFARDDFISEWHPAKVVVAA